MNDYKSYSREVDTKKNSSEKEWREVTIGTDSYSYVRSLRICIFQINYRPPTNGLSTTKSQTASLRTNLPLKERRKTR